MTQTSSAFVADPGLLEELRKRCDPAVLGPDGVLFRQGEMPAGVYVLLRGEVLLTMRSAGAAIMAVQVGAGSLLGLPAVLGDKPYSLTAEASDGAEVGYIASDQFISLMQSKPQFSLHILKVLAEEVRSARKELSVAFRVGA